MHVVILSYSLKRQESKIPVIATLRKLTDYQVPLKEIATVVEDLYKNGTVRVNLTNKPTEQLLKRLESYGIDSVVYQLSEAVREHLHSSVYISINNTNYDLALDIARLLKKHF